jgi:glycosyltransferase involved in cell wall biosynthesis
MTMLTTIRDTAPRTVAEPGTVGAHTTPTDRETRVLYVSWDGPNQFYFESLFFPIFARLKAEGITVDVLQFTWAELEARKHTAEAASRLGLHYEAIAVRRRPPPALASTLIRAVLTVGRAAHKRRTNVLMPRSLIPAGMALAARTLGTIVPMVFEADGFMADERVDFAGWSSSELPYRLLREIESQATRASAATICRSHAAKDILLARAGPLVSAESVFVTANAKDETVYTPCTVEERRRTRAKYGVGEDAPWLVYVGSMGAKYCPATLLEYFRIVHARLPRARLHVATAECAPLQPCLDALAPLVREVITVASVRPQDVPALAAAADLGVAFIAPTFSMRGASPTKVAEYLLCGTPALTTSGTGDIAEQLGPDAGLVLPDLSPETLEAAAAWFSEVALPRRDEFRQACRETGVAHFGLASCAAQYAAAIRRATRSAR